MKLTKEDLSARTNQRVHLDTWLSITEWEQILSNQEKAEKYDWFVERDAQGNEHIVDKLEQENKQLKEIVEKIKALPFPVTHEENTEFIKQMMFIMNTTKEE